MGKIPQELMWRTVKATGGAGTKGPFLLCADQVSKQAYGPQTPSLIKGKWNLQ